MEEEHANLPGVGDSTMEVRGTVITAVEPESASRQAECLKASQELLRTPVETVNPSAREDLYRMCFSP